MLDKIRREPALVTGAVLAVIGVASSFGLGVTDGQTQAIVALVGAALALLGAGVTRSQVTPAALVAVKRDPATGRFVAAKSHPAPTGKPVLLPPDVDGKDHV
jgi:hypothetical protein